MRRHGLLSAFISSALWERGGGRRMHGVGKGGLLRGAIGVAALLLVALPFVLADAPAATARGTHPAFMTKTLADAISAEPSACF